MKKYLSSIAAAGLLAGSVATVAPVHAQTTTTANGAPSHQTHIFGHGPFQKGIGDHANLLGIRATDLQSRLSQGKTFQQIASDLGISQDQLNAKRLGQMKIHLQELVTSGKITQAQADSLLQKMQNHPKMDAWRGHGGRRAFGKKVPSPQSE